MIETLSLSLQVARRNWVVYKRDLVANVSPSVADPLFFIFSLGFGLGAFVPGVGGRSYLQFLAPGLVMTTALMTSFFESSYGFFVRMTYENVYKAMLTTRVGPREVILGEFIWLAAKGAGMSLIVALVFAGFGTMADLRLLPVVLWAGCLVALGLGAIGLLASAWVPNINQFQTVYSFLISPLFFFSGIFFPLESLPAAARWVIWAFPLAHGVKICQAAFWAQDVVSALLVHSAALLAQTALLGWLAWRATSRKLVQ
jgi:lipooligosaccharide transport system permease protein